jgi:hypothetical protein
LDNIERVTLAWAPAPRGKAELRHVTAPPLPSPIVASFSFGLGFILLLSVLSLAGIVVLWWFGLRPPPVRRPSCGHCGYAVEGLEAMTCPECGRDLRTVGIETPKGRMLHPGLFVLFWTLLLIAPLGAAYVIAMRLGPKQTIVDASFGMRSSSPPSSPPSPSSASMPTTTTFEFPTISFEMRSMTVDVRTVSDAAQLRPAQLTLDSRDHKPGAIDRATLDAVFGDSSGMASRARSAEDEADAIALLDALLAGEVEYSSNRLKPAGNTTVLARSILAPWYPFALIAIGAMIYAMGILTYIVIRKKRLAPPGP